MFRKDRFRGYIQSTFQSIFPHDVSKLRQAEDQVYAYIVHSCIFKNVICPDSGFRIMTTVHPLKDRIIERLNSHTYAVNS